MHAHNYHHFKTIRLSVVFHIENMNRGLAEISTRLAEFDISMRTSTRSHLTSLKREVINVSSLQRDVINETVFMKPHKSVERGLKNSESIYLPNNV